MARVRQVDGRHHDTLSVLCLTVMTLVDCVLPIAVPILSILQIVEDL